MQIPLPARPLPLNFFFGLVPMNEGAVVFCTALNDSGAMVQGYFQPDVALKIGRDLLKYGRAAFEAAENKKHLIVATKGGLLVPGR
jgi:hypothetical protein